MQRDLEAFYAAEAARWPGPATDTLTPPIGQGAMGGHYTLSQMEAFLDQFHAQHPSICSQKVSIGTSIQGRPIWMVKISDNVNVDENEPEVLLRRAAPRARAAVDGDDAAVHGPAAR